MKLKTIKLLFLALVSALLSGLLVLGVQAQSAPDFYGHHPLSPLYLGAGLSTNDITAGKESPLQSGFKTSRVVSGAVSTELSATFVRSVRAMKQALGLDFNVDASYLTYSGGLNFKYEQANTMRTEDICFVFVAKTNWGQLKIDNPSLTTEARALLSADPSGFETKYGSRYVSGVLMGASVSCILTFRNVDKETRDEISAQVRANGSFGLAQLKTSASFRRMFDEAYQESRLKLDVVATGGTGVAGLAGTINTLFANVDPVEAIVTELTEYMKGFNSDNATPLGYFTTRTAYLGIAPVDFFDRVRDARLQEVVEKYRVLQSDIDEMKFTLSPDYPLIQLLTATMRNNLNYQIGLYQTYQSQLTAFHQILRETKTFATVPPMPAAPANFKTLDRMHQLGYFPAPTVQLFDNRSDVLNYTKNPSGAFSFGGLNGTDNFEYWKPYDPSDPTRAGYWGTKRDGFVSSNFLAGAELDIDGAYLKSAPASDPYLTPILRWTAPASGWWNIQFIVRGSTSTDLRGRSFIRMRLVTKNIAGATRIIDKMKAAAPSTGTRSVVYSKKVYVPVNSHLEFLLEPQGIPPDGRYYESAAMVRTVIKWDH